MYIAESSTFLSEEECKQLVLEAVHDDSNRIFREKIIDPIVKVLETKSGRDKYVGYGSEFLEANAEMLSKEYPTKAVTFPRKYIDNLFSMFGFELKEFTKVIHDLIRTYISETNNFQTVLSNPSNFIHAIALFYSDMIMNRTLRDSARQQMGLSVYQNLFAKYYPKGCSEGTMAYTYMNLDGSWNLVKTENMIGWIGIMVETSYGKWRTKLSLDMSISVAVDFLNRVRNTFNQSMKLLRTKYEENINEKNVVGADVAGDDEYLVTSNFLTLRDNLMRMIKNGDTLYTSKGKLYAGIARLKNVKMDTLYEFAQKVSNADISKVIDTILYVFIIKEQNKTDDINSAKYIGRITNMPTAVDRAIQGKPIITPLVNRYKAKGEIVKAYICLVATYILNRVNEARK